MRDQRVFGWGVAAALALGISSPAADSPEDAVRKILAQNCAGCHGEAKMSGLDLRDISSILKGGTRGPALVPGRSADSLLYKAITGASELKMPPGKAPLPADA